ncbi:MAG: DEAD/DEAH box helicase [Spirochaetales bacterium]|nr:DEAD/DEAH box helicase [Spirochaetales bacterium]
MTFKELNLRPEILRALESKGYTSPTPIQAKAIPPVLEKRDVLAGAQTGTGKTAAFALPVLELLAQKGKTQKNPRVLVLTPTRELAAQVGENFELYGKNLPYHTETIFGGVKINPQIQRLREGCDVLVATPGRLLDHLQQGTINLKEIGIFILDEADRMLDMGFIRDIQKVIKALPSRRQNLMFSATYSKEIKKLCGELLHKPVEVEVRKGNQTADKIEQLAYAIEKNQKRHLLAHLIKEESWYQVLVFVRTKHGANRLAKQLTKGGIPSSAIHGDKSQGARLRALKEFKEGDLQALIATNVAARGLDLQGLSHVVNFDLPQMAEDYVHRIGRTGRAGESGLAVTFITPDDKAQLRTIEKLIGQSVPFGKAESFVPVIQETTQGGRPMGQQQSQGRPERQGQQRGRRPSANRGPSDRNSPGEERSHSSRRSAGGNGQRRRKQR